MVTDTEYQTIANETENWDLKEFVLMIAQEKHVILAESR